VKPNVFALKLGQKVWATVEEVLDSNDILVNFDGDLLRIGNKAERAFRPGQRIQLHVSSIEPLQFRLVETKRLQLGIDVEI
jgi:hypothetical protein